VALERYEILKRHMHEEAARVIAEAFPAADQLLTKDYLDARLTELRVEMHKQFALLNRWNVTFMASFWLGVAGVIVAIVLK
jgi:hypothetical protein